MPMVIGHLGGTGTFAAIPTCYQWTRTSKSFLGTSLHGYGPMVDVAGAFRGSNPKRGFKNNNQKWRWDDKCHRCHRFLLRSRENYVANDIRTSVINIIICLISYVSTLHCFQGTYWLFQAPTTVCNVFWNHLRTENWEPTAHHTSRLLAIQA